MRGKQGLLRVIEAFIAIMIIAGVMTFIYFEKVRSPREEDFLKQNIRITLKEISNNKELREAVLHGYGDSDEAKANRIIIDNAILNIIPSQYVYEFRICELGEACGLERYIEGDVYSDEVSVSVNLDSVEFAPKKIRLFVWSGA